MSDGSFDEMIQAYIEGEDQNKLPNLSIRESFSTSAAIKVIAVGGGGGNALRHMMDSKMEGVIFIAANTDAQALANCPAPLQIQLGAGITKGLGAGANPEIGRKAAEENREEIKKAIMHTDMLFVTAGFGGGTGTGAVPIVAEIARELNILTVAVITKPFLFEGTKRREIADSGIEILRDSVDSLITIPNDRLLSVLGKDVTLLNAFKEVNDVLRNAVQGISELITRPGLINVDFADVKTVMSEMGLAMMGTGLGSGEDRARQAAKRALSSPLLDEVSLAGARGILVNITAGPDMSIGEFEAVGDVIKSFSSEKSTVVVGTVIDSNIGNEMRVTVVITGLDRDDREDDVELKATNAMASPEKKESEPGETQLEFDPSSPDYLDVPAYIRNEKDLKVNRKDR